MSKKNDAAQEYESDDFEKLNEELNKLAEMIRQFSNNTGNHEVMPQIQYLISEMYSISKKIGGSVFEHAKDLKLDINTFLSHPKMKELTPKIFQDFQLLKNDLRRL